MSLGPMHVGDTGPPLRAIFRRNATPYPITNIPISFIFVNSESHTLFTGHGTVVVVDGANGICDYYFSPNDTNFAGPYSIYPILLDPINGRLTAKPQPLEILPTVLPIKQRFGMGRILIA